MRVEANRIEVGITEGDEPRAQYLELGQIEEVIGSAITPAMELVVTGHRKGCGAPNCCLTADVRNATVAGKQNYDSLQERDITPEINVLQIDISCVKKDDACREVENATVQNISNFFESALRAWQRGEETAAPILAEGDEVAREIQTQTDQEIGRIQERARSLANDARVSQYSLLRRELEQGL